jgi:ElaB/YqjD/DUF883 family membrane-anchored ribosome-binding protein
LRNLRAVLPFTGLQPAKFSRRFEREESTMQENSPGSGRNGDAGARARADEVKDHLRAAKDAASDAVRGTTAQAKTWTRARYSDLQERVEAEPYKAAAWALGVGFLAGVIITALARTGRR